MKTIQYINKIKFSHKGVECRDLIGEWISVHLRQGDLDGACGVYSLTMVLLMLGYLSAYEISVDNDKLDLRMNRGRFLSRFYEEQGLLRSGYSSICLRKDIARLCPDLDVIRKNPKDCDKAIEKIYEYLHQNIPVIISTQYNGGGHFLVAIGAEVSDKKIEKIFCLDPGSNAPQISPWNCYITTGSKSGEYPYWCVSENLKYKVRVDDLIVITTK